MAGVLGLLLLVEVGLGDGLAVALGVAGVLRVARVLRIAGNRCLIRGRIRRLCIPRIGRLVGSRIGLLTVPRVLGDAGIRSLVKSDVGMRDIAGIRSLVGSRGKIELSCVARQGSPVGGGKGMSLLGISGVWRLIGGRNRMVLLGVARMGSRIGNKGGCRNWTGGLIGLLDGVRLWAHGGVMACGRLWLGGLWNLAVGGLRILRNCLLRGNGFG